MTGQLSEVKLFLSFPFKLKPLISHMGLINLIKENFQCISFFMFQAKLFWFFCIFFLGVDL